MYPLVSVADCEVGFVTTTSTAPGEPAGVSPVIVVLVIPLSRVAGLPPIVTVVAGPKLVPVISNEVPPDADPFVGSMEEIVGAA